MAPMEPGPLTKTNYNAPGSGNDSFGLSAFSHNLGPGYQLFYNPGTQSVVIPVDFADFNPGTYQSEVTEFNTPLTVNLTVSPVPEPSALALFAVNGLLGLLVLRRRK